MWRVVVGIHLDGGADAVVELYAPGADPADMHGNFPSMAIDTKADFLRGRVMLWIAYATNEEVELRSEPKMV